MKMTLGDFRLDSLSRPTQILIVAALTVGFAALVYVFVLKGMVEEREAIQMEIRQLEVAVAQATAVESQLERFKEEVARLDLRLVELRKILPNRKETPHVLRSVQQMAAASNLKIIKFNPQPVAPREFYSDWPINMEVEGSYNALGSFFEKIGKFARIINVDNISIKGIDGSTDPNKTVISDCTATTFVFRTEEEVTTATAVTGN
jgi:type IV pilus assembly protein PilO